MSIPFCKLNSPFSINVLRSRDLSSLPSFHLKKNSSTSNPHLCSCPRGSPQQHETLLFPNFAGENFGIQVSNFSFEPSTPNTCIAVLLYVNDQLSYTAFLPKGDQKIIHSIRLASFKVTSSSTINYQSDLQVCHYSDSTTHLGSPCEQCNPFKMLSFPSSHPKHESLLKSYLSSLIPFQYSRTCPTPESDPHYRLHLQTQIPQEHFRIEIWEVESFSTSEAGTLMSPTSYPIHPSGLEIKGPTSSSYIHPTLSNTLQSPPMYASNEHHPSFVLRKWSPHPLAVLHLYFLSFETICDLVTLPNIVNEIEGDAELLHSILKTYPTFTSSVILSNLIELRSMYPFFGNQRLPPTLTAILNRPPKFSKRCPAFKKTEEDKKEMKKTYFPMSPECNGLNSNTHFSFTSPPPTPYSSLIDLPTSSTLPFTTSAPFNPHSLTFTSPSTSFTPTPTSYPLNTPSKPLSSSRGSIPFVLGPSSPSPHLSPFSFPLDPCPLSPCHESIESMHSVAHTLTLLHSQVFHT